MNTAIIIQKHLEVYGKNGEPNNNQIYQSNIKTSAQDRYFNDLVDSSFQRVNRHFALPFETENDRTSHSTYYLPKVEIKD